MVAPNYIDAAIDGGLDYFTTAATAPTRVDVCTTEPTNYTEATSTYTVGNYVIDNTDFTKANGDTSGRKVTLGAQSGNNGTGTGAANFVAFTRTTGSVFIGVINGDGDTVNSGSPMNISAVDAWEIADPT